MTGVFITDGRGGSLEMSFENNNHVLFIGKDRESTVELNFFDLEDFKRYEANVIAYRTEWERHEADRLAQEGRRNLLSPVTPEDHG